MNVLTNILTVAKQIAEARAKSKAAAAQAGTRSTHAEPLTSEERLRNYLGQNLCRRSGMTPRQRRRAEHKANLAAKRAEIAA